MNKYTIRDITEIGILTAFAVVLNLPIFKISIGANGGSIKFALIPLTFIALRKSWWKTLIASIIFSLLACTISGEWQGFIFDYSLAYSSIIVVSLMRNLILKDNSLSYLYLTVALLIFTIFRFSFSCISSMVFYGVTFKGALIYNSIYIPVTSAIDLAVSLLLLKPMKAINKKYPN